MTLIPSMKPKDPDAVLPYQIDWSEWLGATATIVTSSWSIAGADDALELGTGSYDDLIAVDGKSTTVWLSAGTLGKWYTVTNHVETDETPPREDDRSFRLLIDDT